MNTVSTPSLPSRPAAPAWVSIVAGAALACALAPLLPLLSIVAWSSVLMSAPEVALVLATAALVVTHRREAARARLMAWMALAAVCGWVLMFLALGLALLLA